MSENTKNQNPIELENVQEALTKSEQFIEKYQKQMLIGLAVVVVAVSGVLAFNYAYIKPKERKAEAAMYKAEIAFQQDSFKLALNGNGADVVGFQSIIDDYGITKSANVAKFYAGICNKNLGNYEQAVKYLKDFDSDDKMMAPAALSAIGDCQIELGNVDDAADYFVKAADKANNELLSPICLKKAGLAYENLKKFDKAVDVYTTIKEKYFNTPEAADIEKYIERAKLNQ
ncbi:MAG: tetratricopeptide repeat protein [Bacteroidota bacterium]|uniref:tetratricopeptide repeat protein n=1 Tax=Parabacteroides sp. FAFU027 TaxID=2922715 RepID=UPI001FAF5CA3|nr:tetratricopeptide repeat protein [Parabacteroides sp. FAFU027]MDP4270680.1 tetratricopeptide repeat protein [Bacteroidota bacterium]